VQPAALELPEASIKALFFSGPWERERAPSQFNVPLHATSRGFPPCFYTHQPIPMLRQSYVEAVRAETPAAILRVLQARASRDLVSANRGSSVDPLPFWCMEMQAHKSLWGAAKGQPKEPTALVYVLNHFRSSSLDVMGEQEVVERAANVSQRDRKRSQFILGALQNATRPRRFHSRATVIRFLNLVTAHRPRFLVVNDDWPLDEAEYRHAIAPFHAFLQKMYPEPAPWEKKM